MAAEGSSTTHRLIVEGAWEPNNIGQGIATLEEFGLAGQTAFELIGKGAAGVGESVSLASRRLALLSEAGQKSFAELRTASEQGYGSLIVETDRFAAATERASRFTPVAGGVGQIKAYTVALTQARGQMLELLATQRRAATLPPPIPAATRPLTGVQQPLFPIDRFRSPTTGRLVTQEQYRAEQERLNRPAYTPPPAFAPSSRQGELFSVASLEGYQVKLGETRQSMLDLVAAGRGLSSVTAQEDAAAGGAEALRVKLTQDRAALLELIATQEREAAVAAVPPAASTRRATLAEIDAQRPLQPAPTLTPEQAASHLRNQTLFNDLNVEEDYKKAVKARAEALARSTAAEDNLTKVEEAHLTAASASTGRGPAGEGASIGKLPLAAQLLLQQPGFQSVTGTQKEYVDRLNRVITATESNYTSTVLSKEELDRVRLAYREEAAALRLSNTRAREAAATGGGGIGTPRSFGTGIFGKGFGGDGSLLGQFGSTFKYLAFYQLLFSVRTVLGDVFEQTQKYDRAVTNLGVSLQGTGVDAKGLAANLSDISRGIGLNPIEGLTAATQFRRAFPNENVNDASRQGVEAAGQLNIIGDPKTLTKSMEDLVAVVTSFNLGLSGTARVMDVATAAAQRFGLTGPQDILPALATVGDLAASEGFTLEQTAAGLAAARKVTGESAEAIGGEAKRFFGRAGSPAFEKTFAQYGISTTAPLEQQLAALRPIYAKLDSSSQSAITTALGGGRAGPLAAALLQPQANLTNTAGTAQDQTNKKLSDMQGFIQRIRTDWDKLLQDFGQNNAVRSLASLVQALDPFLVGLDSMLKLLNLVPGAVTAILAPLTAVGAAVLLAGRGAAAGGLGKVIGTGAQNIGRFATGQASVAKEEAARDALVTAKKVEAQATREQAAAEARLAAENARLDAAKKALTTAEADVAALDADLVASIEARLAANEAIVAADGTIADEDVVAARAINARIASEGAVLDGNAAVATASAELAGVTDAATVATAGVIAAEETVTGALLGLVPFVLAAVAAFAVIGEIVSVEQAFNKAKEDADKGFKDFQNATTPDQLANAQHELAQAKAEIPTGVAARILIGDQGDRLKIQIDNVTTSAGRFAGQLNDAGAAAVKAGDSFALLGPGGIHAAQGLALPQYAAEPLKNRLDVLTQAVNDFGPKSKAASRPLTLDEPTRLGLTNGIFSGVDLTGLSLAAPSQPGRSRLPLLKGEKLPDSLRGQGRALEEGDLATLDSSIQNALAKQFGGKKLNRATLQKAEKVADDIIRGAGFSKETADKLVDTFNTQFEQNRRDLLAGVKGLDHLDVGFGKNRKLIPQRSQAEVAQFVDPASLKSYEKDIADAKKAAAINPQQGLARINQLIAFAQGLRAQSVKNGGADALAKLDDVIEAGKIERADILVKQFQQYVKHERSVAGGTKAEAVRVNAAAKTLIQQIPTEDSAALLAAMDGLGRAAAASIVASLIAAEDDVIAAAKVKLAADNALAAAIADADFVIASATGEKGQPGGKHTQSKPGDATKADRDRQSAVIKAAQARKKALQGALDSATLTGSDYKPLGDSGAGSTGDTPAQIAAARILALAIPGDDLSQARAAVRAAKITLGADKANTVAYWNDYKALQDAKYQLVQTELTLASEHYLLTHDFTNPILQAQAKVLADRAKLRYDSRRGANTVSDRLTLAQDQAAAERTAFDQRLQDAQTNYQLGRSSYAAYIRYLEGQHNYLEAVKHRTYQQQQELNEVDQALKAAQSALQGQFNIGEIKIPTVYEVRRYIGAQAAGQNYAQTTNNYVQIDGTDTALVQQVLERLLGATASQTRTTAGRKG